MLCLAIAIAIGSAQEPDGAKQDRATVPAIRIYVTDDTTEGEEGAGGPECATSLRHALSPSFSTLLPVDSQRAADVTVRIKRCEADDAEGVYRMVWSLSRASSTDERTTTTNLQRERTIEWHVKEITKATARFLRRGLEAQ